MYFVLEAYMEHSSDKEILLDLTLSNFKKNLWNKIETLKPTNKNVWLPIKHLDDACL